MLYKKMITDIAAKYPHFHHWPMWLIEESAFDEFLLINKIPRRNDISYEELFSIKERLNLANLIVPSAVSELRRFIISNLTYQLYRPSPQREIEINSWNELEQGLKEMWLEMYFDDPAKLKQLKFHQSYPKVIMEWSNSAIGPERTQYFPFKFQTFWHEDKLWVKELLPMFPENLDSQAISNSNSQVVRKPDDATVISGIPLVPGRVRAAWASIHLKSQIQNKIVVVENLKKATLHELYTHHPKGIIVIVIPSAYEWDSMKSKGIPAVYVNSNDLHLPKNRQITLDGKTGLLEF